MKLFLRVVLFCAILLAIPSFIHMSLEAQAKQTVSVDKQVNSSVSKTDKKQEYVFEIKETGKLMFTVNAQATLSMRVYDGNGVNLFSAISLQGTSTNPAKHMKPVYLEKGKYYVDVISDGSTEGKYNFITEFTSVGSDERESNNTVESAQVITNNQKVTGIFSYSDREDFYRLEMNKAGNLTLDLTAYTNLDIEIVNDDKKVILERSTVKGQDGAAKKLTYPILLEQGLYYIKLFATDDNSGKYVINVKTELFDYSEALTNNLKDTAQELENNRTLFGSVLPSDTVDWYVVNVTKPSKWVPTFNSEVPVKLGIYGEDSATYFEEYELSKLTPKTYYLTKGKYYIRIDRKDTNYGLYQLKSSLTTLTSNESAFNNTEQYAETLPLDKTLKGLMELNDVEDVYAVKVPKKGYLTYTITGNSYIKSSVIDEKGYLVLNASDVLGTATQQFTKKETIKVSAGTYYIHLKPQGSTMGTYSILATTSTTALVAKVTSVTTSKANAVKVTGKATAGSTVSVKIGKKTYSAKATSKGTFTVKVPKLKKGAKLTVTAKNSFGTSAKKTVTVKK